MSPWQFPVLLRKGLPRSGGDDRGVSEAKQGCRDVIRSQLCHHPTKFLAEKLFQKCVPPFAEEIDEKPEVSPIAAHDEGPIGMDRDGRHFLI